MVIWKRAAKKTRPDGRSTITYATGEGLGVTIESRKQMIPHADGIGTWPYTSYFVIVDGEDFKELHSLMDAKEYAENIMRERKHEGSV